jgi:GNAT superfamily N-acetyltransferase
MVQQRVDHGAIIIAGGGMHDQPGRLVDHQQMIVFMNDGERDILGDRIRWAGFGHVQCERLAALHLGGRIPDHSSRAGQAPALHQVLQALTAVQRHGFGQRLVQALAGRRGRQGDQYRLFSPHSLAMLA